MGAVKMKKSGDIQVGWQEEGEGEKERSGASETPVAKAFSCDAQRESAEIWLEFALFLLTYLFFHSVYKLKNR